MNFSWVTSKIRGSFVSELLRASWHSGEGGVHGCVWVCMGMCDYARLYTGVRECVGECGMNFQNTYWRLES